MKTKLYILLWMCCSVLLVACEGDDPIIEVTGVTLNKSVLSLDEGESETLIAIITPDDATNKKVTWVSSNASVATVDANGKVTALKPGEVTVIVVTEDGAKMATCVVTCADGGTTNPEDVLVTGVELNKSVLELKKGESETLLAVITPDNATNKKVTWLSSDLSVATVDSAGKVTGLKTGNATIIITTEDGAKVATCAITVTSSQVATRTVLIYLAADNSLSSMVSADIAEMKKGVANFDNSNMHLLVYIDTGSSPRLVEFVQKNGEVTENVIKSYEKRNSVGVAETQEVFNDVFSNNNYRAESYGLVYWSHGDGWVPNPLPSTRWIGQDTGDGAHYMNISDLVTILKGAPHFDFVLFDACFMQSIEVAYAIRNYTDYYLGSPTEIPGPGASYDVLMPAMFSEGDVALETAKAYFTPYKDKYNDGKGITNSNWTGGASISVLKSSELERLADMTKQVLSGTANNTELRSTVYNYDQRSSYSSHVGYYDMVEMMRLLTDNAGFAAWKQVYDSAMPYWATTPKNYSAFAGMFSMEGTNGVSHYIPSSYDTAASTAYRTTEWYEAAGLSKLGW